MAKDNRKQVALKKETAPAAPKKKKRKKKNTPARIAVKVLLVVFLVVLLIFLFVVGKYLYSYFKSEDGNNTTVPIDYVTTADSDLSRVTYYLVGLMGEKSTDNLEALALLCHDKAAGTLDVLQVPVATYLGESDNWTVNTVGAVWANPKELTWCDTCRQRVYAPEVGEDNTHTVCGDPLTTKTGSASENLIDVFNDQYSMPVDAFFILPQKALVEMVDSVGGIDVDLSQAITVDGVKYAKGVQTLDGSAALYYAVSAGYKSTVATDITRMLQQRQVFTSLFLRLATLSEEELLNKVIDPVMSSSTPIRVNDTVQGRRAMIAGLSRKNAEDMDYEDATCILLKALGELSLTDMQYHLLPGEAAKVSSKEVYSVHAEQLLGLLSEQFNPYGLPIEASDLHLTEVKTSGEADIQTASWDTLATAQEGLLVQESDADEENSDAA